MQEKLKRIYAKDNEQYSMYCVVGNREQLESAKNHLLQEIEATSAVSVTVSCNQGQGAGEDGTSKDKKTVYLSYFWKIWKNVLEEINKTGKIKKVETINTSLSGMERFIDTKRITRITMETNIYPVLKDNSETNFYVLLEDFDVLGEVFLLSDENKDVIASVFFQLALLSRPVTKTLPDNVRVVLLSEKKHSDIVNTGTMLQSEIGIFDIILK